jgi:hypothetical protein
MSGGSILEFILLAMTKITTAAQCPRAWPYKRRKNRAGMILSMAKLAGSNSRPN